MTPDEGPSAASEVVVPAVRRPCHRNLRSSIEDALIVQLSAAILANGLGLVPVRKSAQQAGGSWPSAGEVRGLAVLLCKEPLLSPALVQSASSDASRVELAKVVTVLQSSTSKLLEEVPYDLGWAYAVPTLRKVNKRLDRFIRASLHDLPAASKSQAVDWTDVRTWARFQGSVDEADLRARLDEDDEPGTPPAPSPPAEKRRRARVLGKGADGRPIYTTVLSVHGNGSSATSSSSYPTDTASGRVWLGSTTFASFVSPTLPSYTFGVTKGDAYKRNWEFGV